MARALGAAFVVITALRALFISVLETMTVNYNYDETIPFYFLILLFIFTVFYLYLVAHQFLCVEIHITMYKFI